MKIYLVGRCFGLNRFGVQHFYLNSVDEIYLNSVVYWYFIYLRDSFSLEPTPCLDLFKLVSQLDAVRVYSCEAKIVVVNIC